MFKHYKLASKQIDIMRQIITTNAHQEKRNGGKEKKTV
jgi:hypothetical protein